MTDNSEVDAVRLSRRRRGWWLAGAFVVVVAAGLWLARTPIADGFIRDQLDKRGVPARYAIEKIGFRTQRLTNIVIGDPARPDLTARVVEVRLGYGLSGPYVAAVRAEGVRLYGRFTDGRLSFGALDRFRDPTSTDPFALPDLRLALSDARARVETPWGAIGAALNGSGNLRSDFDGRLALVAPRLAAAGCSGRAVSFYGTIKVRDVRPQLVGPLRGASLRCANGSVVAAAPQVALDLSLSKDLQDWRGEADAKIARVTAGPFQADSIAVEAQFAGNAARTEIDAEAVVARLRGPDFAAATVRVSAEGAVGQGPPKIAGRIDVARASVSAALRRSIVDGVDGLDGSPVAPVARKAATALARMLGDVGGSAEFALVGDGQTARFELIAPQVTSASGARLSGSGDSRIAYSIAAPRPAFIAAGRWTFGGGGLPSGSVELDRRADGSLSGVANLAPYAAGGARIALTPVRFSGDRSGMLRFSTIADLSGPLADGRVEHLTVPIDGVLAPTGALALNGGCTRVGAERVAISGLQLTRPAIDLCSRRGAPLLTAGPNGLGGILRFPELALRGTSGNSPFAFEAGRGEFDLASRRWWLALADVTLGTGEDATHFVADRISGHRTGEGLTGELVGASGTIGAVPLRMSDIEGEWRWANGVLELDGGLILTDRQPDARFFPLVSRDAHLTYSNNIIDATARFAERRSGVHILDTVIQHRLDTGTGFADLKVRDLRFDERFQPDQLTRLALGVVANVEAKVEGTGKIAWSPSGVTSRGVFSTVDAQLAAAFGPVSGLTTTLNFDNLIGLVSAPRQTARIAEINPGIPVVDGEIQYQLLGDNRVRIHGGSWPFAGGELLLHPTTLDFNADQVRRLTFDLVGVDAAVFLQQFDFENINATGTFDGTLPVQFDGSGGRIVGGRIDARDGGTLAYVGELTNRDLGVFANFAFGALRSLKYDDLTIVLNGELDGEMVTDIRFGGVGQGEGATRNFLTEQIAKLPLVFNVKITAPFRQLITSAKGFYDPTLLIEQNLPALLRAQREAEVAAAGAPAPVQPPASEPVQ